MWQIVKDKNEYLLIVTTKKGGKIEEYFDNELDARAAKIRFSLIKDSRVCLYKKGKENYELLY